MNNQETIANLNMIRIAFVDPVTKEQRKLIDDTFDNAIKALKQEPCEDAISRQAVLDCQHFIYDETGEELEVILAENVLNLPPVNPQEPLTEEDYIELHDRFGDYVEFVVRDMVSGKGERWIKEERRSREEKE